MPGWPSQLSASGIQSPYIHRANGLLQIAVSTPLRANNLDTANFCQRSAVDTALEISRQLRAKSAKRPCGAPCVGIRRTWSGKSETVQSEDRDVVVLAETLRLFGDALGCLGTDFTSTFETEKLASCALGFNHAVGEQREAVTGV